MVTPEHIQILLIHTGEINLLLNVLVIFYDNTCILNNETIMFILKESMLKLNLSCPHAWTHMNTLATAGWWDKGRQSSSVRLFVVAPCFSSWKPQQPACLTRCRTKGDGSENPNIMSQGQVTWQQSWVRNIYNMLSAASTAGFKAAIWLKSLLVLPWFRALS